MESDLSVNFEEKIHPNFHDVMIISHMKQAIVYRLTNNNQISHARKFEIIAKFKLIDLLIKISPRSYFSDAL